MNIQKITSIKKILIALLLCISASQTFAQSSNGIFFQAVARDNFSNPAKDRNIYVQSTIIQNTTTGTKVLIEVHKSSTDAMGVFNITIGNGQRTGGAATSIATIDWSKGPFYLNLKIAITPFSASDNWDYTKELVDMGTTSFGAVPFAFYSASSAKVDDKLNATDTTKMLAVYAKAMSVKTLETSLATKLTAADTLTMLAPYAKAAYTIDSSFFKTQLATKLSIADSTKYVTPSQLAAKTFDQTPITNAIATKLNIADSTIKFVTPTQLSKYNFSGAVGATIDTTSLSNRINLKASTTEITNLNSSLGNKINITDSTIKFVTPTQLANYNFSGGGGTTVDTTSLSNRINLKANASDLSSLNATVVSNTSNITSNTSAITSETTTARAAELTLTNNVASNITSITANANAIISEATTARAAELTLTNNVASNTSSISSINSTVSSQASSINLLTNNLNSNTTSITSNTNSINNLNTNIVSNTSSITSLNTTIAAATASNTINTLVKRDASGNFSAATINATTINTPIYASTPQALTDGATINWNPALGLNASVTLTGNRTLIFSSTPVAGSYGTLVVTQDGTGGRTLTLPSTTNMVLGSSSSTTIALSTAANAKDILNFYYDGTNCYWNIGQGYGAAATPALTLTTTGTGAATLSGTTLNIPSVSSTVNAGSITGTVAVANGGTGATSLSGLVKGNGSSAMTAATAGTDYLLPTGSAASLTNFPTFNQNTTGNAATATIATTATTAGNITATTNSTLTTLSNLNTVGTITSGTISLTTNISTSGTLTAGVVTYPKTHGTNGQLLSTTGSGTLTWTSVSSPLDASIVTKGIVQLANDLGGTASLPTVNSIGGVSSSTIGTINTTITAATNNNTVSTIVKRDASGNFSAGTITANITGNVTGNLTGNASTATTAGNVTGTVAIANGGTNATTAAAALTNLGAAPLASPVFTGLPQAPTATVETNTVQIATTAFVKSAIRLNSDEFIATAGQTSFAFTTTTSNTGVVQTPLSKPFMYINGTRIKNAAYTWTAGTTTVTYNPTNNNSYTLVVGDRVQFDYAY